MRAVFVSPHYDDVAFSCGGTLLKFVRRGINVELITVFTRDERPMTEFALECQVSKGFLPEEHYLAARSVENANYVQRAGVSRSIDLSYLEAPYRENRDIRTLFKWNFAIAHEQLAQMIASELIDTIGGGGEALLFVPLGAGGHIDHAVVVRACEHVMKEFGDEVQAYYYEELPYGLRDRSSFTRLGSVNLNADACEVDGYIEDKVSLASVYASQIVNQFGGPEEMSELLKRHSKYVAEVSGLKTATYAERFYTTGSDNLLSI